MSSKCTKCKKTSVGKKPLVNKRVQKAIQVIESAMKRNRLNLGEMYHAMTKMLDCAVEAAILRMRAAGDSIRKIARTIHMDDRRVSAIIKANAGKVCKPCKTCKDKKTCRK